jgi:L-alanine-DL-glutamate epimerase-like enolase superfamily enzyme
VSAAPLAIRRIDTIPVALPLRKPLHSFAGLITASRSLVVRIETGNGLVGWGEAGESLTMTGETLAAMQTAIADHLAPRLLDKNALDRAALMRMCSQALYGNTAARTAVEMALIDLAGHHFGVPAVELLGGALRRSLSPLWFVGAGSIDKDLAEVAERKALGYSSFKMKAAIEPLATDILRMRELRKAIGPNLKLSVDANMGWDVPTASRFVRAVEELDVQFVEQPVRSDNLPGMAAVARASAVPIGADEGIHGKSEVMAHAGASAASGVSLKACKAGGLAEVLRVGAVADALGVSVIVASLIESSIATAATLHIGCAMPQLDWGASLTNHYHAEDLVAEPLVLDSEGAMHLPAAPGLGVNVAPEKIEKFRIK